MEGTTEGYTSIEVAYLLLKKIVHWRLENLMADFDTKPYSYDRTLFTENPIGRYILAHKLDEKEITILLLALSPYIYPTLLREITIESDNEALSDYFAIRDNQLMADPTGETVYYIIAGDNLSKRSAVFFYFQEDHFFAKEHVLYLGMIPKGNPAMQGKLYMYQDAFQEIVFGTTQIPQLSEEFPAQQITTPLDWEDFVVADTTRQEIQKMHVWKQHNDTLLGEYGMHKKVKPGYRVLFYGPPGTGKTLAASLLGKHLNQPVFRIDLSVLVSKYIGETEKHLANLFNKAQKKDWILFFDEADSVFGKRTSVKDSHDKYANQSVSYLLQKIEAFPGIVILASNYKDNIDKAFMRRFHSIVSFQLPKAPERLKIWEKNVPEKLPLAKDIDLASIASTYVLNGSHIMNCIQGASLQALASDEKTITSSMLLNSIREEYIKEDRIF